MEVDAAEDVSSDEDGIVGRRRLDIGRNFVSLFIFALFGILDVYLGNSFSYV